MAWTTRKPGYIGLLEDVEKRSTTKSAKELARTYTRLFRERGDKPPRFQDIELGDLKLTVPYIALCALEVSGQCTVRFFGEELRRRIGTNPAGRNLRDFIHPDRADSVLRMMEMIVRYPCGYLANVKQQFVNGRTILVETVAFPLSSSRDGEVGQIILADTPIRDEGIRFDRNTVMLSADVVYRDLIDLGYGVDEEFTDVVSDGAGPDA